MPISYEYYHDNYAEIDSNGDLVGLDAGAQVGLAVTTSAIVTWFASLPTGPSGATVEL